jgi:hypothetical protein
MCNWYEEAEIVRDTMEGMPIEYCFSENVTSFVSPIIAQPGKCLVPSCSTYLGREHISQGKYLCDHHFSEITANGPRYNCVMCGKPLDQRNINLQIQRPRELQYAIHEGECLDYYRSLAGVVLGIIPLARRLLPESTGIRVPAFNPGNASALAKVPSSNNRQ